MSKEIKLTNAIFAKCEATLCVIGKYVVFPPLIIYDKKSDTGNLWSPSGIAPLKSQKGVAPYVFIDNKLNDAVFNRTCREASTRGGVGGGVKRRLDSAGDCCTGSGDDGVLSGRVTGDCGEMAFR